VRLWDGPLFAAASDEDNVLRVYDRGLPGAPVSAVDVTEFLRPEDPDEPEADLEGAALVGDCIFWIGSHSRSRKGKRREIRHRLFATAVRSTGGAAVLEPVGQPYSALLQDLIGCEALRPFALDAASQRPPEAEGGLNIEGLAPLADGGLLIGFRNPVPGTCALLVALRNAVALIHGDDARAELDLAGVLDLAGRGIRALEYVPELERYLIVAGSIDDRRDFALYQWSGRAADRATLLRDDFGELNPEELLVVSHDPRMLHVELFSDDSSTRVQGEWCKVLEPAVRRFRARALRLPVG
jgi:hypothetical protein